ncbi:hypothetical protein HPB50_010420 [Hyalomma asiaticum]|uniref:Uncharacterized protein n=1 Tax=Hyalomma asiaticum TaxID=266040 RepID=A0ACB7SDS5_HYAAI|nr:hypothetical protein HPB50_010420 [Hyalomma asiaticum]
MAHPPHVYFPQVYVIPALMPVLLGVLLPLDVSPTAQLTLEPRDPPLKKENSLPWCAAVSIVKPDRQRHQTFKTTYTACVNRHFLVGTRAAATTWLIRLTFTFHSNLEQPASNKKGDEEEARKRAQVFGIVGHPWRGTRNTECQSLAAASQPAVMGRLGSFCSRAPPHQTAEHKWLRHANLCECRDQIVLKRRRLHLDPFDQGGIQSLTFYCAALFLTLMALLVGSIYLYRSSSEPQMKSENASVWCLFPRAGAYSAGDVPVHLCSVLIYDWVMVRADLSVHAIDERELVSRLPTLRELRQSNKGLSLHVRLSGGSDSRVLGSVLHSSGELHRVLLLQIVAFLELHKFDGLLLDLGEAVAIHRIFTDTAVLNVRNFVQASAVEIRYVIGFPYLDRSTKRVDLKRLN